jgi:hypothetical protein
MGATSASKPNTSIKNSTITMVQAVLREINRLRFCSLLTKGFSAYASTAAIKKGVSTLPNFHSSSMKTPRMAHQVTAKRCRLLKVNWMEDKIYRLKLLGLARF